MKEISWVRLPQGTLFTTPGNKIRAFKYADYANAEQSPNFKWKI